MNVTIYEKHPTELFGRELATSGPYTNVIQGVATGDVVLSQNDMGKSMHSCRYLEYIDTNAVLTTRLYYCTGYT